MVHPYKKSCRIFILFNRYFSSLSYKEKYTGKSRPIIVKFARYNVRKKIFHNKRKLKGKNTESLTMLRVKKLNEARDLYDRNNVWTYDGRIMVKDENNKISVYYD